MLMLSFSCEITAFIVPLSALTPSTKTAPDPFVGFIYSDCSQQLAWDSIYPSLPSLIDPLGFFLNGSAVTWKNGFDRKSVNLIQRGWLEMITSQLYEHTCQCHYYLKQQNRPDVAPHKCYSKHHNRGNNYHPPSTKCKILCVAADKLESMSRLFLGHRYNHHTIRLYK